MQDATAYVFKNLAYAAHSFKKLPLRRQQEAGHAMQKRGCPAETIAEMAETLGHTLYGQQTGSWAQRTILQWRPELRRYVHARLSDLRENPDCQVGGEYQIHYSGKTLHAHTGQEGRKRRSTGRSLQTTTMPAAEVAAAVWGSQAPKTMATIMNGNTWWLATAIHMKIVPEICQLLVIGNDNGKTVCECF